MKNKFIIDIMNGISFRARCVDRTIVKVKSSDGFYDNKIVSFAKMNKNSVKDNYALQDLGLLWDYAPNLSSAIFLNLSLDNRENKDVFFLTTQMNNFSVLNPEKVLGVVQLTDFPKYVYLNYIQTRPDCIAQNKERPYKNIGISMMDLVKKMTAGKDIVLNSIKSAIKFYLMQGFKIIKKDIPEPKMIFKNKYI